MRDEVFVIELPEDSEKWRKYAHACVIIAMVKNRDGEDFESVTTSLGALLHTLTTEEQMDRIARRVIAVPHTLKDTMFWAIQAMILAEELPFPVLSTMLHGLGGKSDG